MTFSSRPPWSPEAGSRRGEKPAPLTTDELRLLLKLERIQRRNPEQESTYQELKAREEASEEGHEEATDTSSWEESLDIDEFSGGFVRSKDELEREYPGMKVLELSSGGNFERSKILILPSGKLLFYRVYMDYDLEKANCEYTTPAGALERIEKDISASQTEIRNLQAGIEGMEEGRKLLLDSMKGQG